MPDRLACLLAIVCLATPAAAQVRPAAPPAAWGPFVGAFDAYVASDSVVGASAVLVRDGRVVARRDVGMADRALGQRTDEQTIYHYGSITKTLTAVAIMQLRDRGLLALDDPVVRWVPELRLVHDPFGAVDSVTVRMLLSHTGGFQNPTWPYTRGRPWEPFEPTRWEQLVAMMPYQEVAFKPGSRWSYSNPAFIYLARIIEAITGDPYQSYVQKNVWTPLGMTRSYFGATPYHLAEQRSNNYTLVRDSAGRERVEANGRDFDPGITIPNGGWNAPLADVVTWAAFLAGAAPGDSLARRRFDGVLRRSSLEEMWRTVVVVDPAEPEATFGLSFFLYQVNGATIVGHTGEQAGFRSFLFLDRRTGAAVVAALNTTDEAHPRESADGWRALVRAAHAMLAALP